MLQLVPEGAPHHCWFSSSPALAALLVRMHLILFVCVPHAVCCLVHVLVMYGNSI